MTDAADEATAVLIRIAGHAKRISSLDAREAGHHTETSAALGELAGQVSSISSRIGEIGKSLERQAAFADALDMLQGQVAALARQLAALAAADGAGEHNADRYQPVTPPRWWNLSEQDHQTALGRLRAWIADIYQPGYGQLAAALPACWESHPLCLYLLDWLSELWSVLYLSPQRTSAILAAQAEWQTRLLPAAADQMASEASHCDHAGQRRPSPVSCSTPGRN